MNMMNNPNIMNMLRLVGQPQSEDGTQKNDEEQPDNAESNEVSFSRC